ncbi:hypothetical protein Ddc_16428 [Ditylenchus destructor]|nr:hypothetical protein Ddc_16428 [Ditylenchus destructor]
MAALITFSLTFLLLICLIPTFISAEGGIAEMKGLTGDAPYLGYGNQEQAPEYFGGAAYRQYYSNPSYGYAPPYAGYRNSYRGYGGGGGGMTKYQYNAMLSSAAVNGFAPPSQVVGDGYASPVGGPFGGSFYSGSGNEWVKS